MIAVAKPHPLIRIKTKPKDSCAVSGCTRPASERRGLCHPCYMAAWRLVAAGKTTWPRLERLGLIPPKRPRATRNPLARAFQASGK